MLRARGLGNGDCLAYYCRYRCSIGDGSIISDNREVVTRARRLAAALLIALGVGVFFAPLAPAADKGGILVVQVEGAIDPPNASLIRNAIERANQDKFTLVILQIDSARTVGVAPNQIVRTIRRSAVPVVSWIGPSGAQARGGAALILEASHAAFAAPGSDIGPAYPVRLDQPELTSAPVVRAELEKLATANNRDPNGAARLTNSSLSARDSNAVGAIDGVRPTLGETIVTLNKKTVTTSAGEIKLSTAKIIGEGQDRRRQPNQDVVFDSLGISGKVSHALLSPSLAYFLLVIGLALIVFEFFAASIGFAALVGAGAVIGAAYGFDVLPVNLWAVGLLLFSALAFAVDAQVGGLGVWTGAGAVTLIGGSIFLYGGDSQLRPAWWLLVLIIAGVGVFYVFAIPPFLRARFSSPTVGREALIGEMGAALTEVNPEGVVEVRDARWRAITNRATPVTVGDRIRVTAVLGFVLEVEPEEGGAQDYREKRSRRKAK